ncbi:MULTISPECIES: hypothetical protein [unclassified Coleofasciculus]|uniref:hypothetical protein n=1 Tax=unclassified Coleofasciculus TaxID=2692782 RepID=UPI00187F90F7|nr:MULTISPECIES: hypothetical protein [unclassified Coleofasciculus]MBE9125429.1 hypothetical protein [Coleofasciculus sp. LEGE 07081]MBE9147115.1 hypothetical protein [Coleofasciculus sp. LEGE 07092]
MCFAKKEISKNEENLLLSSLIVEVDTIFFKLRKADKVIRHELSWLNSTPFPEFKILSLSSINWDYFKKILYKIPPHHLLVDEYIIYMLDDETNSLFNLIGKYNNYVEQRKKAWEKNEHTELINVDDKLAYYVRRLGAMVYHLNTHLNLLSVLLTNASMVPGIQPISVNNKPDNCNQCTSNDWSEWQQNIKFLEVTIDEPYAITTWTLENLTGDAIFRREREDWQLVKISTSQCNLEDFKCLNVSLELAERMLNFHQQKLGK